VLFPDSEALKDNIEVARVLIDAGADLNLQNDLGATAINVAGLSNEKEISDHNTLREHSAPPRESTTLTARNFPYRSILSTQMRTMATPGWWRC